MTRDEAIKKFCSAWPNGSGGSEEWAGVWVDSFAAIGILKLDDGAKNANDLFHERMSGHYGLISRKSFLRKLDDANLKIVEK